MALRGVNRASYRTIVDSERNFLLLVVRFLSVYHHVRVGMLRRVYNHTLARRCTILEHKDAIALLIPVGLDHTLGRLSHLSFPPLFGPAEGGHSPIVVEAFNLTVVIRIVFLVVISGTQTLLSHMLDAPLDTSCYLALHRVMVRDIHLLIMLLITLPISSIAHNIRGDLIWSAPVVHRIVDGLVTLALLNNCCQDGGTS